MEVFRERLSSDCDSAFDGRGCCGLGGAHGRSSCARDLAPVDGARRYGIALRRFAGPAAYRSQLSHLRIAHLTDLHVGRITPFEVQRTAVEMTNAEKPDLVLLSGDFVCHSQLYLDQLTEVIRLFQAPVIAVLGNHDYWSGADEVGKALERGGAEVLRNRNTTITLGSERLQVVGLDDAYTGHARRDEAVKGLRKDLPSIGLSHIAEEADGLWRHGIPLVLSGHTHGGQVTLARLHELAVGIVAGHQYVHGLYGSRDHAGPEGRAERRGLRRRRHRRRGRAVPPRRARKARGHDVRARLRAGRLRRAPRRAGADGRTKADAGDDRPARRGRRPQAAPPRKAAPGCQRRARSVQSLKTRRIQLRGAARYSVVDRLRIRTCAAAAVVIFARMPKYTLPELPYDYGALEPHVSGKIMQLHHDKHHAAYVAGANRAIEGLAEARAKNDFAKIAALKRRWRFTLRVTSCTRCSGRTWPPKRAASRPARSARRSRRTSAGSPSSVPSSPTRR